ncbi:MAG TPA: agmatine deiminase family protein, partial [Gemmatimonadaceae bacterium]|nr:agmatine deiminase family protein [Gemmatimonadaceae bacterium]
ASYANFYITNGAVLVPTFNDPADRVALNGIAEAFPRYTVIGIHAVDLVWGFGTLHCLTQQQPAATGGKR